MKNLVRISDLKMSEIEEIFNLAKKLEDTTSYNTALNNKTFVLFFPNTSIRTRVTFEKGITALGAQVILFPSETLDKKEEIKDVVSYQVTVDLMSKARPNALLNPCPPFYRGEEVSADVIDSPYFVGYEFKKALLYVQQAIILFLLR